MTWKTRGITYHDFLRLLRETTNKWWADEAPHLGAALAFYAALAVAPMLVMAITILGMVLGPENAHGQILNELRELIGPEGTDALDDILRSAGNKPQSGVLATLAGLFTLFFAATGVFVELQDAMNKIWKARGPGRMTLGRILRYRLFSFGMILGVGFLLLISLIISALLAALSSHLHSAVPGYPVILQVVNSIASFFIVMCLFAFLFKYLPDAHIEWPNVWLGASLTAALFTLGKLLIGIYLGRSAITSAYGAAGSLVVLLLWVFFSSQILFFGAEFTYVYSRHHLLPDEPAPEPSPEKHP